MTNTLALIPARAGSKGIPNKNMREMAGRPLVQWTIEAARDARTVSRVVVSSDDPAICALAKDLGCDAIERPAALCADDSDVRDAEKHALGVLSMMDYTPDVFVRLQPTSPCRTSYHIDRAVQMVIDGKPSVVSVCEVREHPYLVRWIDNDGTLRPAEDGPWHKPRQEYPDRWFLNGAIYAARLETYIAEGFAGRSARPYTMPRDVSVDIDNLDDWYFAERRLQARGRV